MGKVNSILSDKDQEEIIKHLLSISKNGVLSRVAQATAYQKFGDKKSTMSSLWKKKADFRSKKKGKRGRKRMDPQVIRPVVRETSWEDRTTLRRLAAVTRSSPTTLHRRVKDGSLKCTINRPSPLLSEDHKKLRVDVITKSISTRKNDKFSYDLKGGFERNPNFCDQESLHKPPDFLGYSSNKELLAGKNWPRHNST